MCSVVAEPREETPTTHQLDPIDPFEKGKHKIATQLNKLFYAVDQLKLVAESRTYVVTADQWERVLSTARKEIDELEMHIQRLQERRDRSKGRRFEW